jgi:hypothetical protein
MRAIAMAILTMALMWTEYNRHDPEMKQFVGNVATFFFWLSFCLIILGL